MTNEANIADRIREHITRYTDLQERSIKIRPVTRIPIALSNDYAIPAIRDSDEVIDAFINLAIEATLALRETYFSGFTVPNLYANTLNSDRSITYGPIPNGEQLIHCHLWEKPVSFDFKRSIFLSRPSVYIAHEGQEPLASLYIQKDHSYQSHQMGPGELLVERIRKDPRVIAHQGRVYFGDAGTILEGREDAYIQRLLRKSEE